MLFRSSRGLKDTFLCWSSCFLFIAVFSRGGILSSIKGLAPFCSPHHWKIRNAVNKLGRCWIFLLTWWLAVDFSCFEPLRSLFYWKKGSNGTLRQMAHRSLGSFDKDLGFSFFMTRRWKGILLLEFIIHLMKNRPIFIDLYLSSFKSFLYKDILAQQSLMAPFPFWFIFMIYSSWMGIGKYRLKNQFWSD